MNILGNFAIWLDQVVGSQSMIITLIGLLSAVIDNVPLVAASMGMYDLTTYPMDHFIWEYLAYCAGTGGSILIYKHLEGKGKSSCALPPKLLYSKSKRR